jgi:RNA exonuclease 4
MPKRKAKSANTRDESQPAKKPRKGLEEKGPKHGGKTPSKPNLDKARGMESISSNWRALSKSLGVSSRREGQLTSAHLQTKTSSRQKLKRSRGQTGEGDKRAREQGSDDVWFDDIPLHFKDGEPVPVTLQEESISTSLITGSDKSAGRCIAMDCEMVGTGSDGSYSMLARVCIINHHGYVLYDTFVAPMDKVTDYRTAISGVAPKNLRGAPEFSVIQKRVSDLLEGRILVGHSVQNDLKALLLSHPKKDTRDTAKYRVFKNIAKTRYPSLKKLAKEILDMDIQTGEHNPVSVSLHTCSI